MPLPCAENVTTRHRVRTGPSPHQSPRPPRERGDMTSPPQKKVAEHRLVDAIQPHQRARIADVMVFEVVGPGDRPR
jgi:hypothetical protein